MRIKTLYNCRADWSLVALASRAWSLHCRGPSRQIPEPTRAPQPLTHLLQKPPEQRDSVPGVLLLDHVGQVLHRNPLSAAPHLGMMYVTVPGQLGQERDGVAIHYLHYWIGRNSLILLYLSV